MLRCFVVVAIALGLAAQPSAGEVLPEFDSRLAPAATDLCAARESAAAFQPGLDLPLLAHGDPGSPPASSRELSPPIVEIPPSIEALILRTPDLNPPQRMPLAWF